MKPATRNTLLAVGSIVVILACAGWIYYQQFKAPRHNVALHQVVGSVMAEQTAKLVGRKAKIVVITIPTAAEPELQTQLDAFRKRLKTLGDFDIKEHELDTKDQPKYGLGTGLSSRRFVRTVKNNPSADAIVSFVGAPSFSEEDFSGVTRFPKFIAESRSPDHLPKLFDKQIIQAAIVSRFVFPAPGPTRAKTAEQWFHKRYQVVSAEAAREIPKPE
jgi:hypothetical protein